MRSWRRLTPGSIPYRYELKVCVCTVCGERESGEKERGETEDREWRESREKGETRRESEGES